MTYEVWVDRTTAFTSAKKYGDDEVLTDTWKGVETELSDGKYYWKVRAKNDLDVSGAWSSVRSFTVDTVDPLPPVLKLR